MKEEQEIIFVYNAASDVFSVVTDFAHKVISPETYACNLCKITFSNIGMKKDWKNFLDSLPHKKRFLHKDQFQKEFPQFKEKLLPAIFIREEGVLREMMSAAEINRQTSLNDLITVFKDKIKKVVV